MNATSKDNWEEVIPHRADDVLLEGIDIFQGLHSVVEERKEGLNQIRIKSVGTAAMDEYLEFNDPAYTLLARAPTPTSTRRSCGLATAP